MRKTKVQILNEVLKKGKVVMPYKWGLKVEFEKCEKITDAISIAFTYSDGTPIDVFDVVPVSKFLSHNLNHFYNRIYVI